MTSNSLAAMELGDELKKDQRIVFIHFPNNSTRLGRICFLSTSFALAGGVNEANEPITFFGASMSSW